MRRRLPGCPDRKACWRPAKAAGPSPGNRTTRNASRPAVCCHCRHRRHRHHPMRRCWRHKCHPACRYAALRPAWTPAPPAPTARRGSSGMPRNGPTRTRARGMTKGKTRRNYRDRRRLTRKSGSAKPETPEHRLRCGRPQILHKPERSGVAIEGRQTIGRTNFQRRRNGHHIQARDLFGG